MKTGDLHANVILKTVEAKLKENKERAAQLQAYFKKERILISPEMLAFQIAASYDEILSMLSFPTPPPMVSAVDSGELKKKENLPVVKDRRGCYKRKKTSDSKTIMSSTKEDGWAWRKYGQKNIYNSKYPRCYYRCTYKPLGCKAIKQVQRILESPLRYQTTYFSEHTCTEGVTLPQLMVQADPMECNLLSFGVPNIIMKDEQDSPKPKVDACFPLEESKEEITKRLDFSHAKSFPTWPSFAEPEPSGLGEIWSPRMVSGEQEDEASGLYLDFEVNQIGDLDF